MAINQIEKPKEKRNLEFSLLLDYMARLLITTCFIMFMSSINYDLLKLFTNKSISIHLSALLTT